MSTSTLGDKILPSALYLFQPFVAEGTRKWDEGISRFPLLAICPDHTLLHTFSHLCVAPDDLLGYAFLLMEILQIILTIREIEREEICFCLESEKPTSLYLIFKG